MNPESNFSLKISPGRVSVQVYHWAKEWLPSIFIIFSLVLAMIFMRVQIVLLGKKQ